MLSYITETKTDSSNYIKILLVSCDSAMFAHPYVKRLADITVQLYVFVTGFAKTCIVCMSTFSSVEIMS